jgi:hypothetical protein
MAMRPRLLVLDDGEGRIAGSPAMDRLRRLAEVTVLDRPLRDGDLDALAGCGCCWPSGSGPAWTPPCWTGTAWPACRRERS